MQLLKSRKGLDGGWAAVIVGFLVVVAVIAGVGIFTAAQTGDGGTTAEADGVIDNWQPIQEASGANDLSVTEQTLDNDNGTVFDSNVVSDTNLTAASDPLDVQYVGGFAVDDGSIEDFNVDVDNLNTSAVSTRNVYVMEDVEDASISKDSDHVVDSFQIESGDVDANDAFDLDEGDYLFVIEARTVETSIGSGIAGADLFDVDLEGDSDEDDDDSAPELHYTIDNVA